MKEHRFPITGEAKIALRLPTGEARVVNGEPGEVVVQLEGRSSTLDRFIVEMRGDEIVVEPERSARGRWTSVEVTIRVGQPAAIRGRLVAADFDAATPLASLHIESASGDIHAGDVAGDVLVRAASGDIRVGTVGGNLEVASASGDVRADVVRGSVMVKTASGDTLIGDAFGDVVAKSASGEVVLNRFDGPLLDVKSLSGDVAVGVLAGRRFDVLFQSLSGEVRTDFPVSQGAEAGAARLAVKTVSGDITVQGAPER